MLGWRGWFQLGYRPWWAQLGAQSSVIVFPRVVNMALLGRRLRLCPLQSHDRAAGCPAPWTFSLSSRERGPQWPDHLMEKWCFSRANVSHTICSYMICKAQGAHKTSNSDHMKDGAAMYMPERFREDDLPTLHALMRDYSFATLVTQHEGVPFASHLPLMLAADEGPYGALFGHMAQANPQWRDFDASQDVLVIFQGPHTYVSPSWYEEDPTNVPTWNYAAVHAYGSP